MQWTDRIRHVKIILVVAAVLIAVASLIVSNSLVRPELSPESNQREQHNTRNSDRGKGRSADLQEREARRTDARRQPTAGRGRRQKAARRRTVHQDKAGRRRTRRLHRRVLRRLGDAATARRLPLHTARSCRKKPPTSWARPYRASWRGRKY